MFKPVELTDLQSLSELLEKSKDRPVLLYKHSISCPVSGQAWYEVQNVLSSGDNPPSCYRVTVQSQPEMSRVVAEQLDVVHHTPQVIVVCEGRASYVASHWQIRRQSLQTALTTAATSCDGSD